jgi:hypothetical protein
MLRSLSFSVLVGIQWDKPGQPVKFNLKLREEDTYVCVLGASTNKRVYEEFCKEVDILYEGPVAMNAYHMESSNPRQRIVVFEKKCQEPTPPAALSVSDEVKTPGEII